MKKLILAAAALAAVPGVACAQDADTAADNASNFAGPRIEARIGYETPTISDSGSVYKIGSAVSFGGEAGFDLKAGSNVTVGAYGNYEVSGVEACDGLGNCLSEKANWSAGARIGYAVSPSVLLYGKLGYNSLRVKAKSGGLTGSDSQGGFGGSLGAEFTVSKRFYAFVEASYADYGGFAGVNLQRRHVATGVGARF